jgi:hypothetical protein
MPIKSNMKEFKAQLEKVTSQLKNETRKNVKLACYEMVAEAKRCTPPHEGEERGKNTVTGNMARHWDSSFNIQNDTNIKVRLFNNVQYASYVESGHKMTKHFVPWLYIDGTNTIARHQPVPGEPLFGLVVGTKTKYVPPEHIVEKAKKRFFEAYYTLQKNSIDETIRELE